MNLTMSLKGNSLRHTPQVRVSPPTNSGSAVKEKKNIEYGDFEYFNVEYFELE